MCKDLIDKEIEKRMEQSKDLRFILSQLLQDAITGKFEPGIDALEEIQRRLLELDKDEVYEKIHRHVAHPRMQVVNVTGDEIFIPKKSNSTDACFDLRAYLEQPYITILPGQIAKISTGIKVHLPEGYVMKMYVRSSTGYKKHLMLANGTGIIDAGYRDEVFMCLYNFGNEPVEINYADRLCQFELQKVFDAQIEVVEENANFKQGNRGGGLGSTGN